MRLNLPIEIIDSFGLLFHLKIRAQSKQVVVLDNIVGFRNGKVFKVQQTVCWLLSDTLGCFTTLSWRSQTPQYSTIGNSDKANRLLGWLGLVIRC